uniref:F-box domain-containing protein n=1 Tax=Glossina pallidipes TaxID=7398 RepID=A0A1B0A868_GLOPL
MSNFNVDNGNSCEPLPLEMCCNSRYDSTNQLDHDPSAEAIQSDIESKNILCSMQNVRNDETNSALALPNEMGLQIFCNLSHGDLLEVKLVCKHWSQLTRASALTRKSKLAIARENLKDICDFLEHNDFKFQTVEIVEEFDDPNGVEYALLLKMFKYLRSDIVQLKLNIPLTLSMLNNPLPKLKELDLSDMKFSDSVSLDLSKFSKLKSLLLPYGGEYHIKIQLLSPLTAMPKIRLEKLRIDTYYPNWLNLLTLNASSLRRLEINLASLSVAKQIHLREIFKKFAQFKVLRRGGVVEMIDQSVRFLLENLPKENRLKAITIDLDGGPQEVLYLITREWFSCIESLGIRLILFGAAGRDSGNLAEWLSVISGKLRRLTLGPTKFTPQELLHSIAPKINTKLTELDLFKPHLTEELLLGLSQRLPNLMELDLGYSQLTDEEMCDIFRHLTCLRHLFLGPCCAKQDIKNLCSKPNISSLKGLRKFRSCVCPIAVVGILNLNFNFNELSHLALYSCRRPRERSFSNFEEISSYFPALEELDADGYVNDITKVHKNCPRLRHL